jgi:hypothetical protein
MAGHRNQGIYKKAIEEAQQEREQLFVSLKDLQKIQQRLTELDIFIEKGKILFGLESSEESPKSSDIPASPVRNKTRFTRHTPKEDSKKPIYLRIIDLLSETGKPMTLTEIAEEFHKRNWKLSKKNGREVLRGAFKKYPEMFLKDNQGLSSLFSLTEEAKK